MKLNRERIMQGLECCKGSYDCFTCDIYERGCAGFRDGLARDALAIINELTEENERLSGKVAEYEEERKYHFEMSRKRIAEAKADTVRKMQERLDKHFCHDPAFLGVEQRLIMDVIDQTAKEMLEGIE